MTVSLYDATVAVAGGAGLIGSYLVDELVAANARVIVIDDFSRGQRRNIADHADRIELREGDLEQPDFAAHALAGCDVVFHLASRAYGVGYSQKRHLHILQHNERITVNMLAAAAKHRPRHLLVTSSSCVYDDNGPDSIPELPVFLGEPERANWGYGWAKRFLEQASVILATETGIPVTIVRPFNIYGERYHWAGEFSQAIPMLVKKIMDGRDPVVVWGSGNQRRNYMHAADCAHIMRRLVEAGHADGPVNIGGADTVSLRELVDLICTVASKAPRLEFDTTKPEGRFIKSADATKLHSIMPDLRLAVDLREGLQRMVGWYHETFVTAAR